MLLPVIAVMPLLIMKPAAATHLFDEPVFWWFMAYVISGLMWLLLIDPSDVAERQWRLRLLSFIYFGTIFILAKEAKRGFIAAVILGCVILAGVLNLLDVMFPHHLVPKGFEGATAERGAGLFINANIAGAFVLLGTIAALPYVPMRFRALVMICAIAGIAPCFSRFAFAFAFVFVVSAVSLKLLNRIQVGLLLAAIPLLAAAAGLYYDILASAEGANLENIQRRLSWFQSFGQEGDDSTAGRADAALRAWQMFVESPLVGHGIGSTSLAIQVLGTHNMYLMLMAEQGIFGLALYLSLVAIPASRGWVLRWNAHAAQSRDLGSSLMLFAMFLAAYGLSSHNVLEEPQTMFLLAFLAAAGSGARSALRHEQLIRPGAGLLRSAMSR
jgi:O-antigen ligase